MSSDPHSPVTLTVVRNDIEAAAIISALSEHGVDATATGGFTAGFRAEAPGDISIVVRREDFERANEALDKVRQAPDFDWADVDVGDAESP